MRPDSPPRGSRQTFRIHRNLVKPQIALEGQTPAQAGVGIEGENAWLVPMKGALATGTETPEKDTDECNRARFLP
jgi:hypothetical protein